MKAIHVVRRWPLDLTTREAIKTVEGDTWRSSILILEGNEGLVQSEWTFLAILRNRYLQSLKSYDSALPIIYHDGWGIELFATEDEPRRRIVWMHSPQSFWDRFIDRCARYCDAFIFDRKEWLLRVKEIHPWIPQNRMFAFCGLDGLKDVVPARGASFSGDEMIVAFVDRLKEKGSRVDRLIQLVERSVHWECSVEWRIYSDGFYRGRLETISGARVLFFEGPIEQGTFEGCHYLLYCNNEIGRPYEMLQSVLDGVMPIIPEEDALSRDSKWGSTKVDYYPSGDLDAVEQIITRGLADAELIRQRRLLQTVVKEMVIEGTRERWLLIEEKLKKLSIKRQMKSTPRGFWTYRTYLRIHRLLQGE